MHAAVGSLSQRHRDELQAQEPPLPLIAERGSSTGFGQLEGVRVLGGCLGEEGCRGERLRGLHVEHHRRVGQVRRLQHGQYQMALLRSCCHLRCMFHLRLMSPSDTLACVGEWMQFMRGEYAAVLGVGSMPDWQWQWVQLPCRDGGRGLLPLVEMAPLAYASSWSLSWPWLMHGGGGEGDDALWPGLLEVAGVGQDGGIIPQRSEVMDELGGVWMGQVQGCAELGGIVGEELANLLEAPRKQRTLASPVLSQLSSMLLSTAPDARCRALLLASRDEWARCWTTLLPAAAPEDRRTFTAPQYRVLSCVTLGLTPAELLGRRECTCGERPAGGLGVLADHLQCHRQGGSQIRRHDGWVLLIRELMELAGRRVRLEPTGLFAFLQQDEEGDDPPPVDRRRPADICEEVVGTGQRIVYDAVVTSTLARTYVVGASRKAGAAAGAGHARKQGKWRALVQAEPDLTRAFQFFPLAAESTGALHHSTRQFLSQLVGEVQGRRRERRGSGAWLRPQEATAAYWRAAMTVELLTWTVEPILSWRGLLQRPGVGAAVT